MENKGMAKLDEGQKSLDLSFSAPRMPQNQNTDNCLTPPRTSENAGRGRWTASLIFFGIGCLFSIVPVANSALYPGANKDYTLWHKIGRCVQDGQKLYAARFSDQTNAEPEYTYPPTAAVLFYAPLAIMNATVFTITICLMNSIAWAFSVWAVTVLVAGKWPDRPMLYTVFPGFAVAPYIWDIQFLGQLNLLLLALTLGAFLSLRYRHPLVVSVLFGFAVSLKAFPLPAIAYFIVRRNWIAVIGSLVSMFAFLWFFPGLIRGFERNTSELKEWASIMVFDQSGETIAGRSSIGFSRRNQSLISCCHRLLRHIDSGDNPDRPVYVNVANVKPIVAQLTGYVFCLSLGLVLLLACRFHFGQDTECEGVEIAMVCTLVPLCSPLAWTYFFCWLLPAWTAIAFWWNNGKLKPENRRTLKVITLIAAGLLASALSEQVDPTLQCYGVTAFGTVALFLALAYIRLQLPISTPNGSEFTV